MVRIKHRYLLVNILYPDEKTRNVHHRDPTSKEAAPYALEFRQPSPDALNAKLLARMVRDSVAELFGDYGSGMVSGSLIVKYFSPATSTAIIRVARAHYRLVWAALTFMTDLPTPLNQPCVMQVVRVSGTIRKAEEEAIRRARLAIRKAQGVSGNAVVIDGVVSAQGALDEDEGMGMEGGIEDLDDDEMEDDEDE
ncbi:RNA-binding protein pop5 [Oleoguttula sp. CCFEE 5521]